MSRFSVKKPLTVFVVAVIIIALGIVSVTGMTPDLLPSIDLPYVVVMTTYPGATPEEVESEVTKPLEQSLATVENLKSVQSISNSNYSLVVLEFENGSGMDTAVVNILQQVDLVEGDDIIISTVKGEKYVHKLQDGVEMNALNRIDRDADWFLLSKGDNLFAYTAEEGLRNLDFQIQNYILYEGV